MLLINFACEVAICIRELDGKTQSNLMKKLNFQDSNLNELFISMQECREWKPLERD